MKVFPFWYTGEAVFYNSDEAIANGIIQNIVVQHKGIIDKDGAYSFLRNAGLFGLQARIKLHLEILGPTVHINYFTSLFESNIVLLFGFMLGIFLNINDQFLLSWVFFALGVLGYLTNVIKVNNYAKAMLLPFGSFKRSAEEQELWEKQKQWIKNSELCSACGEPVNPYAIKCVNCGMHFLKNAGSVHSSLSNTANASISYNLKSKKE